MQYQVPQFIEIEDKIFGPLTLKQFIYVAGGGGLCLLFFTTLPLFLAFLLSLPAAGVALGLAFYKVNDRPLVVILEHAFKYQLGPKLYLWRQREAHANTAGASQPAASAPAIAVPAVSQSKLKELAWSLNIKDRQLLGMADHQGDFAI